MVYKQGKVFCAKCQVTKVPDVDTKWIEKGMYRGEHCKECGTPIRKRARSLYGKRTPRVRSNVIEIE